MAKLRWDRLVGQERVKSVVGGAFRNGALGHAYLFCGERGTGKFAAAVDLATALLCRSADARPCGECPACKKARAYSHPDFHVVMPLVLQAEHKGTDGLTEKGWELAAQSAKLRISDPYKLPQYDGIPNIPVDWIREANEAIWRGATEGAANAVIIDGVDTMRKEAANAMLKTLEEPPAGTVMILLTDKINSVLPTIVSRCQIMRFALLPPDIVCAELHKRGFGGGAASDAPAEYGPKVLAAAACGSLGIAIEEFEDSLDSSYEAAASLWNDCLRNDWEAASRAAEELSGGEDALSSCRKTLKCLVQLLRCAFLHKFGAAVNYIDTGMSYKIELPDTAAPSDVERFAGLCQSAISAIDARGNVMMAMVNFACSLMECINAEKQ